MSRNQQELLRQMQSTRQRLEMAMDYYLANRTRRFTQIHHRLQQQHPQLRLARQQTMLERLQKRMSFALENQLKRTGQQQQRLTQRLNQQNPQPKIHRAQTRIQQLEYRLAETLRAQLSATRERFGNAVTHLEAVSPLSTLARGYSVTTASDGNVLKKVKQVKRCIKPARIQRVFSISSHARADRSNLLHHRLLTPATVDGSLDKELSFQ